MTVDSSRFESSHVMEWSWSGVKSSPVMEWSLVQCRGVESGQVGWGVFLVRSGRVKSSRDESS